MKPLLALLLLLLAAVHGAEPFPIRDKTLVVWVSLASPNQRGGSALTIDDQHSHFDGLVFGELAAGKWMAGSDFHHRTAKDHAAAAVETAAPGELVQMATVYHGTEVTLYRNGREYSHHSVKETQEFGPGIAVLIGLRHLEAGDGACLAGAVADARLYATALSAKEIAALKPKAASEPKPLAWWNFEDGKAADVIGTFPEARLAGTAHIENGRLILDGKGSYLVTPPGAAVSQKTTAAANLTAHDPMPVYHFTSPTGRDCSPFDPNGAVFYQGRYHLGYIYQDNGKHYWGHASTTDLVHWQMHPPMLSPGPEGGIFSGNAFIDKLGRVVLSYHGLGDNATHHPAGNCLAIAQDKDLNVFKKLPENPVMKDPGWDPHTWLEGSTYYSISGGNPGSGRVASLYTCADDSLAKWKLLGPLMSHDMPDVYGNEDISCPDLFKLGDKHILLCISHVRGARYYVGRFENKQFHPESHHRMNWPGGTCFAPETLVDDRGRRLMWAWVLGSPSTMSLPRVLSLDKDSVLHIDPPEELNALRKNPQSLKDIEVAEGKPAPAKGISGDCKELHVVIDPGQAISSGVKVRCSPDGQEETAIAYEPARKTLRIETGKSSLNRSTRPHTYAMTFMLPKGAPNPEVSDQEAPLDLKPGELLDLHIYLDHSILEVFANGRQCITQRLWPTRADSTGVAFFARGGDMKVQTLEAWDMAATSLRPLDQAGR